MFSRLIKVFRAGDSRAFFLHVVQALLLASAVLVIQWLGTCFEVCDQLDAH